MPCHITALCGLVFPPDFSVNWMNYNNISTSWRQNLVQNLAFNLVSCICLTLLLGFGLIISVVFFSSNKKVQQKLLLWIYLLCELKFVYKTVRPTELVIVLSLFHTAWSYCVVTLHFTNLSHSSLIWNGSKTDSSWKGSDNIYNTGLHS